MSEKTKKAPEESVVSHGNVEDACLLLKLEGDYKTYVVRLSKRNALRLVEVASVLCDGPMDISVFGGVEFKPRPLDDNVLIYASSYRTAKEFAMFRELKSWNYIESMDQIRGLKHRKVYVLGDSKDKAANALEREAKIYDLEVERVEEW